MREGIFVKIKTRIASLLLASALAVGLTVPVLAVRRSII